MTLINVSRDNQSICQVVEAKSFWQRSRGLMFRQDWPADKALWIHRCNSIHTCFMKFPIDVVFVDKKLVVQKVFANIPAWRLTLPVWSARSVFEFTAGNNILSHFQQGDQLHVDH